MMKFSLSLLYSGLPFLLVCIAPATSFAQEIVELEPIPLEAEELKAESVVEPVNLADFILTQEELRERDGSTGSVQVSPLSESGDEATSDAQLTRPHIIIVVAKNHSALAASSYLDATQSWLKTADEFAAFTPFLSRLSEGGVQFNSAWSTGWDTSASYRALLSGLHPATGRAGSFSLAQALGELNYQTAVFGHWAERVMPSERGFAHWEITQGEHRLLNPVYAGSGGRKIERGHETELTADKLINWLRGKGSEAEAKPVFALCQFESPGEWPLGASAQSGYWGSELMLGTDDSWQWHPAILWRKPELLEQEGEATSARSFSRASSGAVKLGKEFAAQRRGYYRATNEERWPQSLARVTNDEAQQELLATLKRGNSLRRQAQATGFSLSGEELQRWQQQRYLRSYLEGVRSVDFALTRIARALEDEEMLKNTLLIYTSSLGTELGERGWIGGSLAGQERGLRVPMVWFWPRVLPAGKQVEVPVQSIDLVPSVLALLGAAQANSDQSLVVNQPEQQGRGSSLLPLLTAQQSNDEFKARTLYFADVVQARWEGALEGGVFRAREFSRQGENQQELEKQDEEFWQKLRQTWSRAN